MLVSFKMFFANKIDEHTLINVTKRDVVVDGLVKLGHAPKKCCLCCSCLTLSIYMVFILDINVRIAILDTTGQHDTKTLHS